MTTAVAVAAIPPRGQLLRRALASVARLDRLPDEITVAVDYEHQGAAVTRNRAWRMTTADRVLFLDDDDELLPNCLTLLSDAMDEHDADVTFGHPLVVGGTDPFPQFFGKPWDPTEPRQTTVVCLWRREALEKVGGFPKPAQAVDAYGNRIGEEFMAICALNDTGGRIVHVAEQTFRWHHWCKPEGGIGNTSGRPDRW